jgi:hypothetical protein
LAGCTRSNSLRARTSAQAPGASGWARKSRSVAVASNIDIRERSYAVFEKPFIAGASFVQIVGRLDVDEIKRRSWVKPYPEIREAPRSCR